MATFSGSSVVCIVLLLIPAEQDAWLFILGLGNRKMRLKLEIRLNQEVL